jgi:hypothetical protein
MNAGFVFRVILALILLAGVAGVAVFAYNAGVTQGLVQSGNLPETAPGIVPYRYVGGPFFYGWWGFPFLGCLFPLLLFVLFFLVFRGLFWGGPWRWGGSRGYWGGRDVPPQFEEWHRRAHESKTTQL